jgi:DNA repair protein SbcC/Rad50
MELRKLIEKTELKIVKHGIDKIVEEIFQFLIARRCEEQLSNSTIAEYVIVKLPQKVLSKLFANSDLTRFQELQSKLLSKLFFGYHDDMRWNIYLLIIVDSIHDIPSHINLFEIENDENYARKFIFTEDEALNYLQRDWMKNRNASSNISNLNPQQQWITTLDKHGLTGILTNKYSSKEIDEFLDGKAIQPEKELIDSNIDTEIESEPKSLLSKIRKVNLGDFRPHCFGKELNLSPTQINLIHGSNGSGKTSFLEAIELSLTGMNRRQKEFGVTKFLIDNTYIVCDTIDQKIEIIKPHRESSVIKLQEETWYGVPVGRTKTTINENFHKFNYFDSEEAFKFALEESDNKSYKQFDFSESLSRLIFGETLFGYQKNWTKFKEEFKDKKNQLFKQLEKITQEEKNILLNIDAEQQQYNFFDQRNELAHFLPQLHIKSRIYLDDENNFTYQLENLYSQLAQVSESVEILSTSSNILLEESQLRFYNQYEIHTRLSHLKEDFRDISEKIFLLSKEHEGARKQYEESTSVLGQLSEEKWNLQKNINDINFSIDTLEKHKLMFNDLEIINEKKHIENEIGWMERHLVFTDKLKVQYPSLIDLSIEDIDCIPEEDLMNLKQRIFSNEQNLKSIESQKKEIVGKVQEIDQLLIQIKNLGLVYIEKSHNKTCPLCNHQHSNFEALAHEMSISDSKGYFSKELNEIESLSINLAQDNKKLNELFLLNQSKLQKRSLMNGLFDELIKNRLTNIRLSTDKEKLIFINEFFEQEKEIREKLILFIDRKKYLESLGVTTEAIREVLAFVDNNGLYLEYKNTNKITSYPNFEEYLQKRLSELKIQLNEIDNSMKNINIKGQQHLIESVFETINQNEKHKKILEDKLDKYASISLQLERISTKFDLPDNIEINQWIEVYHNIKSICSFILDQTRNNKQMSYFKEKLNQSRIETERLRYYLSRCNTAINIISSLPMLSQFVDSFIGENIQKIEKFFRLLHTPREFEGLKISKGGLLAKRKSTNEWTKAFQMSNGQRASFALSVLFTLHLAAPNAPKFLLLDEPVANMDDLHLLNLIDVIRDLALMGHQIFFTTANTDVAHLFRRKFSFFEDKFTHFDFSRGGDAPSEIKVITYNPKEESAHRKNNLNR